jgi:hypothetical protein
VLSSLLLSLVSAIPALRQQILDTDGDDHRASHRPSADRHLTCSGQVREVRPASGGAPAGQPAEPEVAVMSSASPTLGVSGSRVGITGVRGVDCDARRHDLVDAVEQLRAQDDIGRW